MLVYPLEMAIYEGLKPFSDPYSYSVGGAGVQFCSPTGSLIIGGYHFVITIWGDFPRLVINRTSETRVDLDHCKGTWLILAVFLFISVSMVNVSYNSQQVWLLSDYLLPGCIPILRCTNILSLRHGQQAKQGSTQDFPFGKNGGDSFVYHFVSSTLQ